MKTTAMQIKNKAIKVQMKMKMKILAGSIQFPQHTHHTCIQITNANFIFRWQAKKKITR